MFKDLIKIIVFFSEFGVNTELIIDNEKKVISLNEKKKTLDLNDFNNFLNDFLRIIRTWESKDTNKNFNDKFILNISFFENKKEYNLCINNIPDNFDSFMDLINEIVF